MAKKIQLEEVLARELQGQQPKEIARALRCRDSTIYNLRNTQEYRDLRISKREELFNDSTSYIVQASLKATKRLVQLLDDPNAYVRLETARLILKLTSDSYMTDAIQKQYDDLKALIESQQD